MWIPYINPKFLWHLFKSQKIQVYVRNRNIVFNEKQRQTPKEGESHLFRTMFSCSPFLQCITVLLASLLSLLDCGLPKQGSCLTCGLISNSWHRIVVLWILIRQTEKILEYSYARFYNWSTSFWKLYSYNHPLNPFYYLFF